jgi:hypothetical protein
LHFTGILRSAKVKGQTCFMGTQNRKCVCGILKKSHDAHFDTQFVPFTQCHSDKSIRTYRVKRVACIWEITHKPEGKEAINTRTRSSRDCIQMALERQRARFAIFTGSNRNKSFKSWDSVDKVTYLGAAERRFGAPVKKKMRPPPPPSRGGTAKNLNTKSQRRGEIWVWSERG